MAVGDDANRCTLLCMAVDNQFETITPLNNPFFNEFILPVWYLLLVSTISV